ncbi:MULTISPECIES: MCR_0457 family protein [Acinetobacter calcoaceticus/baumannii complex]|uniref:DUF7944 domain-containing protein n=1 Tax=Acinetobacter lactucae TaxID=1785128 RepID=R8YVY1_9GAMM|nr:MULTISPECIES: hypothetical protein [Acinetobacter calcoaceticus/baumannii complex]EOQ73560.1 hypothetical protein F929_03504 [Acinetobacter lactucae]ETR94008.1 hypothetical protein M211_2660 [Acinetobacter lactucae]MBJ8435917.1 hypothetical protein [Acinetobacter lactucae]MCG9510221.1 hypothetical protein [Acinetobacter pittii]MCU4347046.1 hypothetical protein [Acinetobacter lactucae]
MFMKKSLVQSLSLVLLMSMATVGFAADKKKTTEKKTENENVVEVTPQQGTTPEELAAIQVLSEICPDLIGKKDTDFAQGYERLVKDYLPNESDAVSALEKRSKDKGFKKYLKEARKDAKAAGDEQNTLVCQDVKAYQSQN